MTPGSFVEQLLAGGESREAELEPSAEPMDRIARTVCALLNTDGGFVVVGVDDEGRPNGTAAEEQARALRSYLRSNVSPGVLIDCAFETTSRGPVISVSVPAGLDRPYVFQGAVYIRQGSSTRAADAATLRALIEERGLPEPRWERRPSVGFELEDVDEELLADTVHRAQTRRGYRFDAPDDPAASLMRVALIQSGRLTNAADVLFGRGVSRRHPQTRLRAVRYATDRSADFLDEQLYEGPAFRLLEDGMTFLKRHVAIGAVFKEGQVSRESRPSYPFSALREGLVNALVHRDYAAFSGGVSISIYPERVEIWNTGRLPRGLSPRVLVHASHPSILVNPDIGHVFYLHELMERVGRGTYTIAQECLRLGMPAPAWKNAASGVRLTLFAAESGRPTSRELNDRQKELLAVLPPGQQIRASEYLERIRHSVTERQARRDLAELERHGYLIRHGSGSRTVYERAQPR